MIIQFRNTVLLVLLLTYSTISIEAFRIYSPGNLTTTFAPTGNVTIEERIVGGAFASEGQIRHQAIISRNGNPFCGGSLITANYVLTAAHCVLENGGRGDRVPVFQLAIRVGTVRLSAGQSLAVAEIKIHPNYRFLIFDVALCRLGRRVTYDRLVNPIRLASTMVNPGTQMMVSGFGATRTGGGMDSRLRFVTIPVLNDQDCFRRTQASPSVFCLGHPQGRGICQGDSGGPAFIGGFLYGVVSFTLGGCGTTAPDGFAKIPNMYRWLMDNSR